MNFIRTAALLLVGSFCFALESPTAGSTFVTPAAEATPKTGVEVIKMTLCRDLKDREPVDEITSAKVGDTVVGWSQIRSGLGDNVSVIHRWMHEGEKVSDITLPLHGSPYRTWSRKTLAEEGKWSWQIVTAQGDVLKEVQFTVSK
jgi:hypothetical protein